ncbi:unnamed protein product [Mytilus coruscus]|uniref:Endonuclease/exonuclease/phosphatase domain-containing protein n=1 Tax=Mytilus coruscus TaxID=42192 RepID=A0A6J8EJ27_MYTCO|nr:unnamed protein product [Mytilus coruscus]
MNKASNLGHKYTHILINGDFNFPDIDWENWNAKNEISTELIECLNENFLQQIVVNPTRIRIKQEPSILDLIIVNDVNNIANIEYLDPLGASDHCVLKFDYMCYFKYTECAIERLNYYNADYDAMRHDLNIDCEKELEHKNTNDMLKAFMDKLNQAVSKHVPKSRPKNSKVIIHLAKRPLVVKSKSGELELHRTENNTVKVASSDSDKAEVLADFFSSVFTYENDKNMPVMDHADHSQQSSDREVSIRVQIT